MPKASNKRRKTDIDDPSDVGNTSTSLQMELELLALKAKNSELTKNHARTVHENLEMRSEILALQCKNFDLESKCNAIQAVLKHLTENLKNCAPSLVEVLNMCLQVDSGNSSILSLSNLSSSAGYTPKAKAITHTVKPHTVNGTVLNLNPTISLTRLTSNNDQRSIEELGTSPAALDYRNSVPSTSNTMVNIMDDNVNNTSNSSEEFVLRRSQMKSQSSAPIVTSCNASFEMELQEEEESEDDSQDENAITVKQLSTIQEESFKSHSRQTGTSIGEVRIWLTRLSTDCIENLQNSCSSTKANINDTCLNIETTVIENQDPLLSQRLRAELTVFSPHLNSTLRANNSPMPGEVSEIEKRPLIAATSTNQRSKVTPNSSLEVSSSSKIEVTPNSPNPVLWLPTPSMSAMGDIDKSNYSTLQILTKERQFSPRPSRVSGPKARPSTRLRQRSEQQKPDDSPRSSRRNLTGGRVSSTSEITMTPTIVLDKINHTEYDRDDPKENENTSNSMGIKVNKRKTQNRSRSSKQSFQRNRIEGPDWLQDKIKEVQIRLSNYVADSSPKSPEKKTSRPARAARPTVLKDASLKKKLRRDI